MQDTKTRKSWWDTVLLALLFGGGQAFFAVYLRDLTDNDAEFAAAALIAVAIVLFAVRLWQAGKFPGREKFYPMILFLALVVASSWHVESVVSESSERGRMSLLHFGVAVLFLWAVHEAFDKQLFSATRIASYSFWLVLFVNEMSFVFVLSGRTFSDTLYLINIGTAAAMTILLTYIYHTQKAAKKQASRDDIVQKTKEKS